VSRFHLIAGKALNRPNIHIVDAPDHIEPTGVADKGVRSKPNSSVVVASTWSRAAISRPSFPRQYRRGTVRLGIIPRHH